MTIKQKPPAAAAVISRAIPRQAEARRFGAPRKAYMRNRHFTAIVSFALCVILPVLVASWYLWVRAADQYASYVGFLVRSEQSASAIENLGGLLDLARSSSTDTDVLYKFIQSRALVDRVNRQIDLRTAWSRHPGDFVFSYRGGDTPEALLAHWQRKVKIYYDQGMLDLRVLANDPAEAQAIAQAILDESQRAINQINAVAREDSLQHAQQDLERAVERLKVSRQAMGAFRNRHQIIDAGSYVSGQEGLLASLQQQLAEALIQLGMMRANAGADDPRISQALLRVDVIRQQIADERQKVGSTGMGPGMGDDEAMSDVVSQFEALSVDRQFAENAYTAALVAYEAARAEADRQALYLATYLRPTLAHEAEYPARLRILILLTVFLLLAWLIGVMTAYSFRDRR